MSRLSLTETAGVYSFSLLAEMIVATTLLGWSWTDPEMLFCVSTKLT